MVFFFFAFSASFLSLSCIPSLRLLHARSSYVCRGLAVCRYVAWKGETVCDPNSTPMPEISLPQAFPAGSGRASRRGRSGSSGGSSGGAKRGPVAQLLFSAAGGDTRGYLSSENRTLSEALAFGIISSYEVRKTKQNVGPYVHANRAVLAFHFYWPLERPIFFANVRACVFAAPFALPTDGAVAHGPAAAVVGARRAGVPERERQRHGGWRQRGHWAAAGGGARTHAEGPRDLPDAERPSGAPVVSARLFCYPAFFMLP
jgi:hypothetical protein